MEELRSCENCGNTRCSQSALAIWWDACIDDHFTGHWKPQTAPPEITLFTPYVYAPAIPARLCLQLAIERRQLTTLQWSYALHMDRVAAPRLPWLERAIDGQRNRVRMLTELRSAERPGDCPQNHGLVCADPESGGCLWNRMAAGKK